MMISKQSTSGHENWFSSIPPWARATGVLTICIGTATGLIYFLDQSSKNSTAPLGTNSNPNPNPNPPSTNTNSPPPLEINTPNPNSNLPTPSNPKAPFPTPNSPGQSLNPFTANNSNIPNQSNPNSNINPNTGINPLNSNGQTRQSLNIPVGDGTNQSRNINPQNLNISTTSVPELDNIVNKAQQTSQVIPQLPPQKNRQISTNNINPTGQRNQYPLSGNQTQNKTIPIFSNQNSAIISLQPIDNLAKRNMQNQAAKKTNISNPIEDIQPLPETKDITDTRQIKTNINNQNNSIKNTTSSKTQTVTKNIIVPTNRAKIASTNPQTNPNITREKGKIAANNSQTNTNTERKNNQQTTLRNPATPPTSDPKFNPPAGIADFGNLPTGPSLGQFSNNSSSNVNNTQSTPPPVSKSEISQKKMTSDIALQIPPSPPSLKRGNSEKVQNDSDPAKNTEEILIENPDKIAINTPKIMETTPSKVIIPQVAEAKEYLQKRWKVPDGLNQTIEYIVVLDSDGTITQIEALGDTAKKYREATNIPAPGDKFVSPLSLVKSPKIRVVFDMDGKVQTFLESE